MSLQLFLALLSLNTLFAALAVLVVLFVIRFLSKYLKLVFSKYKFFIRTIPLIQLGLLVFITINILILVFPQSPLTVSLIILGVILFDVLSGWQFIRDFVAGMFLRIDNDFDIGSVIRVGDHIGTIKKRGYRSIEIEKENSETIQIPYNALAKNFISHIKLDQDYYKYRFQIKTNKELVKNQLIGIIKRTILNSTWSPVNRAPKLIIKSETDQFYELEISGYSLHPFGVTEIENLVKMKFQMSFIE